MDQRGGVDGGGVGGNDQHPLPHAPDGWPADDVATVIVGFPPNVRPPMQPLPILRVVVIVFVVVVVAVDGLALPCYLSKGVRLTSIVGLGHPLNRN